MAFYSLKLTPVQINYVTTEKDLLSIVETLKTFRAIILVQRITIYTYHKNLRFENFTTEIVLRLCLRLEEFGPEIKYIKGPDNDATDALSGLRLINSDITERYITRDQL